MATPANATAAKTATSFILFMVWFLSLLVVVCSGLDRSADQTAHESADERGADSAPVLRVEGVIVAEALRRVMPCRRRRRRSVADGIMPWSMVPCGCRAMLRRVPRRGWSFDRVPLRSGRPHRRGGFALWRRIASGCRYRRSAECAADRESHHHLLYCLVHCLVPFVFRASRFSRLHRVRASRRKFLTKFLR